jgi:phosphatidylserine synthase 1
MNAFPHGPFVRPHPLVWRIIFGISVLYLLLLTGVLMLSVDQVRSLLNTVDPSVGLPFALPDYTDDCSLTWENVVSKMDRFVPAHFFGWLVKGLMIRHRVLLWTFSIGWELLEISLVYAVPNFGECFWDQWIMDVLICNGLGIEAGLYLCKYLEHKRYKWSGVLEVRTLVAKIKRAALQFTPESWTKVEWESVATVKRYMQVQLLLLLCLLMELNAFLLKLNLYIPTEHQWNLYRMLLVMAIALPSIRQYYLYCVDSRVTRLGSQAVVAVLICFAELSLIIKTTDAAVFQPPQENIYMWLGAVVAFILASVILLLRTRTDAQKNR